MQCSYFNHLFLCNHPTNPLEKYACAVSEYVVINPQEEDGLMFLLNASEKQPKWEISKRNIFLSYCGDVSTLPQPLFFLTIVNN